jgi:putative transposase
MGHRQQQQSLFKTNWSHRFSHGGVLRQKKLGRGQRPLSCKEPLHLVFKVDRLRLRHRSLRSNQSFSLILHIIKRYSLRFQVKIEQLSVQGDHIHILLRAPRRSRYHFFFRVVREWRAYRIVRDYIQLNEKEICGKIPYQKARLRGLSNQDWQWLWG